MSKFLPYIFIVLICSATAQAADTLAVPIIPIPIERNMLQKAGDDISIFGEDMAAYFTAPFHFTGTDWLVTGGIVGGTMAIMPLDNWGQERAQAASRSDAFQSFMTASRQYGEIVIAGGITGGAYIGGL